MAFIVWHWLRHQHFPQLYMRHDDGSLECTVCHRCY
jgi:hypothetical protein